MRAYPITAHEVLQIAILSWIAGMCTLLSIALAVVMLIMSIDFWALFLAVPFLAGLGFWSLFMAWSTWAIVTKETTFDDEDESP